MDDDPLYLRSIRRAFRTCNDLDLTLLPDAGSALDYVDREEPDMVVLDVYMPGMDGVEACRRLRSLSKDTVIVLASCEMTSELRKLSLSAGASFALAKPYDLEQLIEGSQAMRDALRARLIASHLALALNVAAPLARRFDHLMTAADIESLARLGLCQAAARFDLSRPEPFIAFASRRIRGAVLDEVRRLRGRTRTARTRVAEVVRLRPEWPSEDPTPDAAFERAAILHRLARARSVLSPLESAIVERHYSEDLPLRTIASALGLELTDVQKLHTRVLAKLRRAIEGAQRS